jgi:NSS family neurotransmitter:Na+ symporter
MRRNIGCILFGFIAWLIGLASVFSFNLWADIYPLGGIELFRDKTIFDLIDYLTANIFMPIGAILISLFVGWRLKTELLNSELEFVNRHFFQCWLILVRFLAPLAILVIFVSNFY